MASAVNQGHLVRLCLKLFTAFLAAEPIIFLELLFLSLTLYLMGFTVKSIDATRITEPPFSETSIVVKHGCVVLPINQVHVVVSGIHAESDIAAEPAGALLCVGI